MSEIHNSRIGFMQGRLSPMTDGKIQSFPWDSWENEFSIARNIGLSLMEWTIDSRDFILNPILVEAGCKSISKLKKLNNIQVDFILLLENNSLIYSYLFVSLCELVYW